MKKMWPWILIIVGIVVLDQVTKYLVFLSFSALGETVDVLGDFLQFTYVRNSGAAFGLGSSCICEVTTSMYSAHPFDFSGIGTTTIFFLIMFFVALVIFIWMFVKNDFKNPAKIWYTISLTLLISGALGNTIDRIFQPDHCVIDFIAFSTIWEPVFNVADSCLTVGIILFLVDQFILEPRRSKKKNAS